jgi:ribosomal protein S18 acetylase RimI-like enzyme
MTFQIARLQSTDHAAWLRLARGYKDFYNTATSDAEFDTAWQRLLNADGVHGLGCSQNGELLGIVHFLFHTSTWAPRVCYLQDLYTAPAARSQGVARGLIDAVAAQAHAQGATRLYWLTQDHNTTARRLYDQVAKHHGFIRYDYVFASVPAAP